MYLFRVDIEILKEKLIVPDNFWETWEDRRKDCNGCGTGWNENVVPDTVYGLNIRIVCCIHDREYEIGGNEEKKRYADQNLHDNIEIIINEVEKKYGLAGVNTRSQLPESLLRQNQMGKGPGKLVGPDLYVGDCLFFNLSLICC